jgi:hypothetical protein
LRTETYGAPALSGALSGTAADSATAALALLLLAGALHSATSDAPLSR